MSELKSVRRLAAFVAIAPLMFAGIAKADKATYVGRDNSAAADAGEIAGITDGAWRTSSVAKPLDIDGDNIYGTDGYALFMWNNPGWTDDLSSGADPTDGTGGDLAAQNLLSLPSYIDSVQVPPFGWGGGEDNGNRGFVDDPEFEGFLHNATIGATSRDIDPTPRDCEVVGCTGANDFVATYGAAGGAANVAARTIIHRATNDPFRLTIWNAPNDPNQTQTYDVVVAGIASADDPAWGGDSPAILGVDSPADTVSIELDAHTDGSVAPADTPSQYYVFDIPAGTDPVTVIAYNESNDNPGLSGFMFDTGSPADPYSADALRGVNQLKNPGFEIEGPGGEGDSALWTMNQERAWGTRVNYDSHSGDWSLEVDNTAPSDFGRWKEGKTDDPTEHIGGPMINPADGSEILPENCRACYPIKPGESYTQSMMVKLLEMPDVDVEEGEPAMHIMMGMRANWAGAVGQNGGSDGSEKFYVHELPLNEWTKLENTIHFGNNDVNGNEIWVGQPIFFLDMDEGGEENLSGLMLWDDVYWGLTPEAASVPTDGLVVHYDFEEIQDGFVLDQSGNGLHGLIIQDPDEDDALDDGLDDIRISDLSVSGYDLGNAVHFDTDSTNRDPRGGQWDAIAVCDQENYVEGCDIAADNELIPADGFTVSAWLRVEDTGKDQSVFQSWATGRGFIHTQVQGDGRLRFRLRGDANSDNIVANNVFLNGEGSTADPENDAIPREEWFHWVGSYQSSEVEDEPGEFALYFNGEEYASGEANGNAAADPLLKQLGDWGQDAYVGLVPDLNRQFDGHMDEFRLYNRGVTADEASALYNYGMSAGPACDVNGDGTCDAADIDAMSQNVIDGTASAADRNALIEGASPDGFNTYIGDSDLNGTFDEQDIVAAFIDGKYLSGDAAGWAQGDWDGNLQFDEQDFVQAFIAGGYLAGPRGAAAVPEPSSLVLLGLGLLAFARRRR